MAGTDDNTKPWDAPDPAQLRITATPAPDRHASANPPRPPGARAFSAPQDATTAIDAPPIPRGRHGRAPAPAVVDIRAPPPRPAVTASAAISVAPQPTWSDSDPSPSKPKEDGAPEAVMPWSVRVGIGVGVAALALVGLSIGYVVGKTASQVLTGSLDVAQEVPVQPNVPAFRGIGVEGAPGSDRHDRRGRTPRIDIAPRKALLPRPSSTPAGAAGAMGAAVHEAGTNPAVVRGVPSVIQVRPRVPSATHRPSDAASWEIRVSDPDDREPESVAQPADQPGISPL